jgi:abhydrolase domain-containing protein 13
MKYIFEREELQNSPIILYGQSLGGAVAIYLAEKHRNEVHGLFQMTYNQIDALVIENTFTDMPTVARGFQCFLSLELTYDSLGIPGLYYLAPLLCSEKWRSVNLLPKLTSMPILFLAGGKDEVIPPVHMKELYALLEKHPAKSTTIVERS